MKNKFFQYHMGDYIDDIYKDALIILDANALLNLYRYNKENREKYFEIITYLKDRLILPFQVGLEFYKNRINLIKQRADFKNIIKKYIKENLEKLINVMESGNVNQEYNPALIILRNEDELKDKIISIIEKSKREVIEKIDEIDEDVLEEYIFKRDPILNKVNEIFYGKVNEEFTQEELIKIYKDGEKRYKDSIPPGYKDNKDTLNKYGDLIIWNEMINIAKVQGKDILFVSDDRKEDWALKHNGIDLGPRKELIKEFYLKTERYFYSITTREFIRQMSILYDVKDIELLEKQTNLIQTELLDNEIKNNISKQLKDLEININTAKFEELRKYLERLQSNIDFTRIKKLEKQLTGIQPNIDLTKFEKLRKQLGEIEANIDFAIAEKIKKQTAGLQNNVDIAEINKIRKQLGDYNLI